ncbi:hypothetical protein [Streptomyces gossypii]
MVGSVGFFGVGTAVAGGPSTEINQTTNCKSHDLNISVLSNIGVLNGALGNLLNGEGNPGQTVQKQGSTMGCSNAAG